MLNKFADLHSGLRVSKIWGDILVAANQKVSLLQFYINNLQIRVGNGCRVSFWHDCWTGGVSLKESFPRLFRLSNEKDGTLRDYADKRGNSENWVISFRRALFQWEQEELLNLNLYTRPGPTLNMLVKDRVLWLASKSGQSFVSTLHKHTDFEHGEVNNSSRLVWIKYLPPKVQFFGWLAWKHKVKTSVFLHRIGVLEDSAHTVFAMPETSIGLFPDVGASHFLSRLPGFFGEYLGLTGARLDGIEMLTCGLATHFVNSKDLDSLEIALNAAGYSDTLDIMTISKIINKFVQKIREGRTQKLKQCLVREFNVLCHIMRRTIHDDFFEVVHSPFSLMFVLATFFR
ncbi:hypothetical protein ACSBR2_025489 [Camellia fascicularis]